MAYNCNYTGCNTILRYENNNETLWIKFLKGNSITAFFAFIKIIMVSDCHPESYFIILCKRTKAFQRWLLIQFNFYYKYFLWNAHNFITLSSFILWLLLYWNLVIHFRSNLIDIALDILAVCILFYLMGKCTLWVINRDKES